MERRAQPALFFSPCYSLARVDAFWIHWSGNIGTLEAILWMGMGERIAGSIFVFMRMIR